MHKEYRKYGHAIGAIIFMLYRKAQRAYTVYNNFISYRYLSCIESTEKFISTR